MLSKYHVHGYEMLYTDSVNSIMYMEMEMEKSRLTPIYIPKPSISNYHYQTTPYFQALLKPHLQKPHETS